MIKKLLVAVATVVVALARAAWTVVVAAANLASVTCHAFGRALLFVMQCVAWLVVKVLKWLRLTYSQSNSFSPGAPVYDVYWQPLPDPRGKTKDYGFDLDLFRDATGQPRLNLRAKQYETIDSGRSTGDIPTITDTAVMNSTVS